MEQPSAVEQQPTTAVGQAATDVHHCFENCIADEQALLRAEVYAAGATVAIAELEEVAANLPEADKAKLDGVIHGLRFACNMQIVLGRPSLRYSGATLAGRTAERDVAVAVWLAAHEIAPPSDAEWESARELAASILRKNLSTEAAAAYIAGKTTLPAPSRLSSTPVELVKAADALSYRLDRV